MRFIFLKKTFKKALEYYQKGLDIYEEDGDKHGVASGLTGIGPIYSQQGDYDKALSSQKKSLNIYKEINDTLSQSYSLSLIDIASIYANQEKYSKSIEACKKSLK
ncbi:tetratricopeptide repeat protein [Okeania hirsuta]|uniref:tetratricopeptide repeat protein n=1 Tax=Okeania hirsuta TaxID=1458930 RepID=UPI001374CDF0|nr:tetratricopeptide repeat protein [Okeania hirsuta]